MSFLYTFLLVNEKVHCVACRYVVDISQHTHFDLMKKALEAIDRKDVADLIRHVPFGRVRGMSTRQGEV